MSESENGSCTSSVFSYVLLRFIMSKPKERQSAVIIIMCQISGYYYYFFTRMFETPQGIANAVGRVLRNATEIRRQKTVENPVQ